MKFRYILFLCVLINTQMVSAETPLVEQGEKTTQISKMQLAENLVTQLNSLSECQKTMPYQLSKLTELVDYMNQTYAKYQLLIDRQTALSNSSANYDVSQLNLAKKDLDYLAENFGFLDVMYRSLGGTENLMKSIKRLTNPCLPIEVEVKLIAAQQKDLEDHEGSAYVRPRISFESCISPPYPRMSLRNGEIGTVGLMFLIESDGTVAQTLNRISSGYPLLDFSALEHAKLCKFKPATLNGASQRGWTYVNFDFKLPD